MKILLVGDASNYHNTLATGLRKLGHEVVVASSGMLWQNTSRDIDLRRGNTRLSGAWLWARLNTTLARRLSGFDIVQIVNPVFVDLKPHRVASVFRRLRRSNGAVYLTALGTDTAYVQTCLAPDNPLRFSEWAVDGQLTPFSLSAEAAKQRMWLDKPLRGLCEMIYENIDGAITALYEYHAVMQRYLPPEKLAYGGIPIDTSAILYDVPPRNPRLKAILPYPKERRIEKGTDILFDIFNGIEGVDLETVAGLSFDIFLNRLRDSDVVIDQLYAHTPATTALLAMAMGKTVVTGASDDFERFIGEKVPAYNINPHDTTSARKAVAELAAMAPDERQELMASTGRRARSFVERHNDATVVARRFVDFWQR